MASGLVRIAGVTLVLAACEVPTSPAVPRGEGAHKVSPTFAVVRGQSARVENIVPLSSIPAEDEDGIIVVDINRFGVAVGYAVDDFDEVPVVWTDGGATELPAPPGWGSSHNPGEPEAINDAGQIVGHSTFGGQTRAALWSEGEITPLEAPSGADESVAFDINKTGDIVGTAWFFGPDRREAVLWRDGVAHVLPPAPGHAGGGAESINDAGVILGHSNPDDIVRRMAVWAGGELSWVDAAGRIEPILYHWNGITNAGLGYASYNIAGDTVYVWENGQLRTIAGASSEGIHVEDVSPDGALVGRFDGTYGVWTDDEVFHPWDKTQVDRCTQIAEDRWVACVKDSVWFVAQFTIDGTGTTDSDRVSNLRPTRQTATSVMLSWTQVDDGTGNPAWYRLKYAEPSLEDWKNATIGCARTIVGDEVGAEISCTVEGLDPATSYDFQLMSYRVEDGVWRDARYSNVARGETEPGGGDEQEPEFVVSDLSVTSVTGSTATLAWTQVDDGTGNPAWYRLKYAEPPLEDWKNATIGCDRTIVGDEVGTEISCTVEGLDPVASYDFQLMSYRVEDGVWVDAQYSNVATGQTN